ncbi:hypothetical protein JCM11251_001729 [Rhodosporidiobolus azoricus]
MSRQSDLSAFLGKKNGSSTTSGPTRSKSASASNGPTRRVTRSASAASISPEPPKKRVKRKEQKEEEQEQEVEMSDEGEEDVKPKIKREDSGEKNGHPKSKSKGVLREEEHGVLPPDMRSTPLAKLYDAMRELSTAKEAKPPKDGVIVYWSRNKDLRITDNTALSHASAVAQSLSLPLLAIHIFSPSDYKAHDRSPRRIDFQLRQLKWLQGEFAKHDIPLYTFSHPKRKEIPQVVCEKLEEWGAAGLYANLEYEVDELRRDTEILQRTKDAREKGQGWGGKVEFFADYCVVAPGKLLTKQGKPYSVYSPFQRSWAEEVNKNLVDYVVQQNPPLAANDSSARSHSVLSPFFSHEIPASIKGFELSGEEEAERMKGIWPVGEGVTDEILRRFLKTRTRTAMFNKPPLEPGAEEVDDPEKESRVGEYQTGRNRVDLDGTSHISAYLAAGVVSPRDCLRAAYEVSKSSKLPSDRNSGIGFWTMEIAWRDFYQHVLCAWPRVCMSKPYNLKYDDTIEWATDDNDEKLEAWKKGRTGVPIVDAAMRALNEQGYMHNRCRMIVAMYLTKDLLLDWRAGEKYFMQQLVDGDLGCNNGGWQWSASTGCDPQPYFRIFNPISQSEKVDPDGTYIKYWVPELRSLKGKAIHNPSSTLSPAQLRDKGYLAPIVDHAKARTKAIEVYKNAAQAGA